MGTLIVVLILIAVLMVHHVAAPTMLLLQKSKCATKMRPIINMRTIFQ